MSIVNHIRNRELLLEAIRKASEAKAILNEVADLNGQSRYFKSADRAYPLLEAAVSELTGGAAIETPELIEQRKEVSHNWEQHSPLEGK